MGETITVIPESAWLQAVFVCLFLVLVAGLLAWFSKQQKQWQDFINKRDDQWQSWLSKSDNQTAVQMAAVTDALERLAVKLDLHDSRVVTRLETHDEKVEQRLQSVTQPRRRQS